MDNFLHSPLAMAVVSFFTTYLYIGVGITLGYHRLLTHKSLQLPKWLEYLIVSGGYFCLMGSPIVWVAVHRLHHLKSDQPGDPHSPRDGFTHALYKWMFDMYKHQSPEEVRRICADIIDDPIYKHFGTDHSPKQASLCLRINIISRVLLFGVCALTLGLGCAAAILLANLAATFTVFWSTQFVNTFCHMENHGYRTFQTREDSRNVWWVGILACGEGWHNNHHAMPKSAQHGMAAHEFDITWITIWVLEKLGLAKAVVRPNPTVVRAKRLTPVPHNVALYTSKSMTHLPEQLEDYNETVLVGAGAASPVANKK